MWNERLLGHGVGLRSKHFGHLLEHGVSGVAWFEIISENFFEPGGRPWVALDKVRAEVPVVMHGVSLGIGNVDPISNEYLERLIALAARIEPAWISDHLCWGANGGRHSHDLLPLPYTEEALDHIVERVNIVQDRLKRPLMLENVSSYVSFRSSTMPEWEFVNEVARRTDSGILLDVNNIYVSSKNHGFSAETYLDAIDADRVGQFHLAGHTVYDTHILDSHIGPVPSPVWELYRRAVKRFGRVSTLIEWDEEIPDYETLVGESRQAIALEKEALDG
ncbi:MAG: DUF692 domain-containing protein [Polyangiaceae bacterium]